MNNTIIYAHPYDRSFNSAILEKAIYTIEKHNGNYTVIDLYKDGFDPVMSADDLKRYMEGATNDPLIKKYNDILDNTDRLIFIFPIWWYDMPAIMRGFLDKVLLSGSSYIEDDNGMHPVRNIEDTLLFTTSSAPTDALVNDFNDPVNKTIIGSTFKCVGFNNARWYNLGSIASTCDNERDEYLNKISDFIVK